MDVEEGKARIERLATEKGIHKLDIRSLKLLFDVGVVDLETCHTKLMVIVRPEQ